MAKVIFEHSASVQSLLKSQGFMIYKGFKINYIQNFGDRQKKRYGKELDRVQKKVKLEKETDKPAVVP